MNVTATTASRNYTSQQHCLDVADIGEGAWKTRGRGETSSSGFSVSTEMDESLAAADALVQLRLLTTVF